MLTQRLSSIRNRSGIAGLLLLIILTGCHTVDPQSSGAQPETQSSASVSLQTESSPGTLSDRSPIEETRDDDLWSQLSQADAHYFVLMRHALAPGTGDPENFQLADCSTQRNLSEEGSRQAQLTGEAFRRQEIPVRQVLSSQWCRCLETAERMNLGPVQPFPPLNSFFRDRNLGPEQTAQLREFMLTQPNSPGVTVMVTHFVNISALSGMGAASGELVIMQVSDDSQLEVVGRIAALSISRYSE
jgi:hypothetical protein